MLVSEVIEKRIVNTGFILPYWESTQLLGRTPEHLKPELAVALENQRLFNETYFAMREPNGCEKLALRLSIPIVVRVFNGLLISELVTVQSQMGPCDRVYYLEGNELIDDDVTAKTRKRKTYLPWRNKPDASFMEWDTGAYIDRKIATASDNLYREVQLAEHVSNSLVNELQEEIINDLLRNSFTLESQKIDNQSVNLAIKQVQVRKNMAPNWIMFSPGKAKELGLETTRTDNNLHHCESFNGMRTYVADFLSEDTALMGHSGEMPYQSHFLLTFYTMLGQQEMDNSYGTYGLVTRGTKKLAKDNAYVVLKAGK